MQNLFGKLVVATGSALIGGVLVAVAWLSSGAFVLAGFLAAIFLIDGRYEVIRTVFTPIMLVSALVFVASAVATALLGAGTWWVWKKPRRDR